MTSSGWTGRRLGGYEVQAALGAGGMGEVYRALDTALGRVVAIKVLPDALTRDPDRLVRFEREARVLASLNHPHIGAIFGLEEADGVKALVLEFVEGETLADRIGRGAGGFRSEAEIAEVPGVEILPYGDVALAPSGGGYAYSRDTITRNLYRVPLP